MILPSSPRFFLPCCALLMGAPIFTSPARALPTTNPIPGISGLGVIPTTDTVLPGSPEVSLGYERVDLDEGDGDVDLLPVASLIYGFKKGEAGATYVRERSDIEGFSFKNSYYSLQGKYRVYERENLGVALGAHYYDFGSEGGSDLGSVLSGYATASYTFRSGGGEARARLHGGLLVQRVRGGGASDTPVRPFGGAEYLFTPEVSLAADYLASDEDAARAFTLSLRYLPQQSPLSAQIGVGKLHRDTKFFIGLSYRFGAGAQRAPEEVPVSAPDQIASPEAGR